MLLTPLDVGDVVDDEIVTLMTMLLKLNTGYCYQSLSVLPGGF